MKTQAFTPLAQHYSSWTCKHLQQSQVLHLATQQLSLKTISRVDVNLDCKNTLGADISNIATPYLRQTIEVTWHWRSPFAVQIIKCFHSNHMRRPAHPHTHSNRFIYRLQTEMTSWFNLIVNNRIIHGNKLPKWGYTHESNLLTMMETTDMMSPSNISLLSLASASVG